MAEQKGASGRSRRWRNDRIEERPKPQDQSSTFSSQIVRTKDLIEAINLGERMAQTGELVTDVVKRDKRW